MNQNQITKGRRSPEKFVLTEEQKDAFSKIVLLVNLYKGVVFTVGCEGTDTKLNDWFISFLSEDVITQTSIDGKNQYVLTQKGEEYVNELYTRNQEFNAVYQVYMYVDFTPDRDEFIYAHTKFFELDGHKEDPSRWEQYCEEDRWYDLRLAVVYYKGLDPLDAIFLNTVLTDEVTFSHDQNLSLQLYELFYGLEEIVNDLYFWEQLSGKLDNFTPEDVQKAEHLMEKLIPEGNDLMHEMQLENERLLQEYNELIAQNTDTHDTSYDNQQEIVETTTTTIIEEDQSPYMESYYHDPYYVSPLWGVGLAAGIVGVAILID